MSLWERRKESIVCHEPKHKDKEQKCKSIGIYLMLHEEIWSIQSLSDILQSPNVGVL